MPVTWLTPRISAVAVAKRRAAAITLPPVEVLDSVWAGSRVRVAIPSTVSTVPPAIAIESLSPRTPIASAAAKSGLVAVKVETRVAPARLYASLAKYMDSAGCMMPVSTNIQKPVVNQSSARIQNGAVRR